MSQELLDELVLLVRSGWQLIALETFEEERALHLLKHAARHGEAELTPSQSGYAMEVAEGEVVSLNFEVRSLFPNSFPISDSLRPDSN